MKLEIYYCIMTFESIYNHRFVVGDSVSFDPAEMSDSDFKIIRDNQRVGYLDASELVKYFEPARVYKINKLLSDDEA